MKYSAVSKVCHDLSHSSLLNINTGHIPYVMSLASLLMSKQSVWTSLDPGITLVDGAVRELWLEVGYCVFGCGWDGVGYYDCIKKY